MGKPVEISRLSRLDTPLGRAWLVFWVLLLLVLISQMFFVSSFPENHRALDFRMRYNEAECVRSGKDPYLVWNGTLEAGRYTPWDFKYLGYAGQIDLIHAYPPWEYAWMLPLTFLPRDAAEILFRTLSLSSVLFIVVTAFMLGYGIRQEAWAGFAVASAVLFAWPAMRSCLEYLNFGIPISAAVLMALLCHRGNHDWLAGVFWSFVMVKPQLGGLFVLALIVRWKWRSLLVVGMVTLFGTLVSAAFCRQSPLDMVLSIANYSCGQFSCVGFIAPRLFSRLASYFGETSLIAGSALLGAGVCALLCCMLRSCEDVFEWAVPPAFLSTLWVVARSHDLAINTIVFLGLSIASVRGAQKPAFLCNLLLILFVLLRGLDDMLPVPVNVTQIIALVLMFIRTRKLQRDSKGPCDETVCRHSSIQ